MNIHFRLAWLKSGASVQKAFKEGSASSLFGEYTKRISQFASCHVSGGLSRTHAKEPRARVWICHRGKDSKTLSSEELATQLSALHDSGIQELRIVIGGPDGFSEKDLVEWQPDLKWSFGPLTLPHELAAIVACEQIYRAFTILQGLPYHLKHS